MERRYFVYVLTNRPRGVLYVGVTSDLARRISEHKAKLVPGFTNAYGVTNLVYCEEHGSIDEARARERVLKRWRREWKFKLVEEMNPDWNDLSDQIALPQSLEWSRSKARETSMLILYDFGNSVCCQKVRITLRAKGLEWQSAKVDLFKGEQYDPDYLKYNPKGVVPTLVHDGTPVIESTLICEYLDDTFPEPPLVPKDPAQRARMRLWSKMVDEGLFEGVSEISFSAMFREKMRSIGPEMREKRYRNVGDPRRRDRVKSTYEQGVQSPFVLHAIFAYERAFKLLEQTLAESGPWVVGASPTLADINLMPFAARLDYLGLLDLWTGDRPHVRRWWAMAQDWPSFKSGLSDLISETEFADMKTHGPAIRNDVKGLLEGLRKDMAAPR